MSIRLCCILGDTHFTLYSITHSVTLSWKEYKGFGTAIYQQVSGKWKQIKWFEPSHIYIPTSYTINDLKPNTTYKFAVRHHMGKENMSSYSYVTVKTKKEAVNIKLYSAETGNVTLYWNEIRDADGYYIYKRVNNKWKRIGNVWEESCTVSGLTADTNYKFAVKPYYITGSSSKAAKFYGQISVRTSKKLDVKGFIVSGTDQDITITWDSVEGATGYRLYIKKGDEGKWERVDTFKANVTGYMLHERSAEEKWYFRIRAYAKGSDGIIWGPYNSKNIDYVNALQADILMSDSTEDSITVNWRKVEQATGYEVYVNLGRASSYYSYEKVADIDSNDITSYTATELECDESYPFKIRAYKTEEDGTVTYYPYGAEYRARTTKKTVEANRVEKLKKKLDAENVCFKFTQYTYEGSISVDYVFARTKGKIFLRETYGDTVTEYLYSEKTDRTYIIFDSTKRYTIAPEGSGYKEMLFMFDELIRIGEIEGVTAYDDSEFDGYSSICETYTDAETDLPMRYYFDDDGSFEGFCISENDDPETIFINKQLKSKASSSVFSVPKKYQYVKYSVLY